MTNRWVALAIIFVSFIQFTLNWFCIIPAFGSIIGEMGLSFAQVGVIVGTFIAGYGIAHIPGGWIAERYGLRTAILLGIALETAGAALSGWAPSYQALLAGRLLCGVGGSIYIGSAVGLTAAWFHDRELATANGLITGVAFTVGAAVGLFGWGPIVAWAGWRTALLAGAAVGLATLAFMAALFPAPPGADADLLRGEQLSGASLRRVFGNPLLWVMGLAFLGGYGGYFTAAQLLPHYAQSHLNLDAGAAEGISVILLLSGIPGAFAGGWLADRALGIVPTFLIACVIEGVALILVPYAGPLGLELLAAVIGATAIAAFVVWVTIPGQHTDAFLLSDIPTAAGPMLTIVAVGGAVIPPLFSQIATGWGFKTAWAFEGVVSLGFALFACLALARRKPGASIAAARVN